MKKNDNNATRYVYQGLNLVAELDEQNKYLVKYYHAPGTIDRPLAMEIEGKFFYYHYDERGSVIYLTNEHGHIIQKYVYDTFGRIVIQIGELPNEFTYTGRQWDPEAKLYHYRARVYDADTGTFLQEDPVYSINPYSYVDNDPINYIDPLGLIKYTYYAKSGWFCRNCDYEQNGMTQESVNEKCPYISTYETQQWGSYSGAGESAGRGWCITCWRIGDRSYKSCDEMCKDATDGIEVLMCRDACEKAIKGDGPGGPYSLEPKNNSNGNGPGGPGQPFIEVDPNPGGGCNPVIKVVMMTIKTISQMVMKKAMARNQILENRFLV